jgi:hypothetical protein
LSIAKALIAKQVDVKKIAAVLGFLQRCLVFTKPENNRIFRQKLDSQTNNNNPMGILDLYKEEGREEGIEQGREEGREKGRGEAIAQLIENTQFSDEQVAGFFKVSVAEIIELRRTMQMER